MLTGDTPVRRPSSQSPKSLQVVETTSESNDTRHSELTSIDGTVNQGDWYPTQGRADLTTDTDKWEA